METTESKDIRTEIPDRQGTDAETYYFHTIMASSPVAVIVVNASGHVVFMNPSARNMLLEPVDRRMPLRCGDIICCINRLTDARGCGYSPKCRDCPFWNSVKSALETGATIHEQEALFSVSTKDGKERADLWLRFGVQPISFNREKHVIVSLTDVTEMHRLLNQAETGRLALLSILEDQRRIEQKQSELQEELRQSQKLAAVGFISGGVAHEINNPLTGILNYAQLLKDGAAKGSQAEYYASEIIRETGRVGEIARNLLSFARKEPPVCTNVKPGDIIKRAISLTAAMLRRDGISTRIDANGVLPRINCREQQIGQVLINLILNARDALNERPGAEDKSLTVSARAMPYGMVRITVEDNGAGIAENVHDRIFAPFFTTKEREKGTGLGLPIAMAIVTEHGGRISFESKSGGPTRFYVDLHAAKE